jgi:hypothetical protein
MMDECAVCGELLDGDEPHPTIDGEPVCANADECTKRWVSLAKERRRMIRHLDPTTHMETRGRLCTSRISAIQGMGWPCTFGRVTTCQAAT